MCNEQSLNPNWHRRLEARVRAGEGIAPLRVVPEGDQYVIVDGCLRFEILEEMGAETVRCRLANGPADFPGNGNTGGVS